MNHEPVIRTRAEHCISRRGIDPDALKVLYRLVRRGHTAYLVGGGVRDLLLQRTPKDFDVGTDAHPNRIKSLFRNCFLIGRRFRLAHIKYGQKVIETSTFRRMPEEEKNEDGSLLQKRDNTFGSPEEDARRRDFTINGLFYDIETFNVIDYVGGLSDLDARLIRSIGDPNIRFKEDPVRMMRAIRFASRLGFDIEENTYNAILNNREEILHAAPPRLLEEVFRLFAFASGEAAFRLLHKTGLMEIIFPQMHEHISMNGDEKCVVWKMLCELDRGDNILGEATQPLMFATLALPRVLHIEEVKKADNGSRNTYLASCREAVAMFDAHLTIPKRMRDRILRILSSQQRFQGIRKRRFSKVRFAKQDYFSEALALYEIHTEASGGDLSTITAWRELYVDPEPTSSDGKNGGEPSKTKSGNSRKRRGRRRKPRKEQTNNNEDQAITSATVKNDGNDAKAETAETDKTAENNDNAKPEKKKAKRKRPRRRKKKAADKDADNAQKDSQGQSAAPSLAAKRAAVQDDNLDVPLTPMDFYLAKPHDSDKTSPNDSGQKRKNDSQKTSERTHASSEAQAPHWLEEI